MNRFVILHHRVGSDFFRTGESHFDWMFETEGVLRTFATPIVVSWERAFQIKGVRLPDHRIEYLTFEGDLPAKGDQQNRGSVHQVAVGTFAPLVCSADRFEANLQFVQLDGETKTSSIGHVVIQRTVLAGFDDAGPEDDATLGDRESWIVRFSPA